MKKVLLSYCFAVVALFILSCTKEDTPVSIEYSKDNVTIVKRPYSLTVSDGPRTRMNYEGNHYHWTYDGEHQGDSDYNDCLYIINIDGGVGYFGEEGKVYGKLVLQSIDGDSRATFRGEINYAITAADRERPGVVGETEDEKNESFINNLLGGLYGNLRMSATLVDPDDQIHIIEGDKVTGVNFRKTATQIASNLSDAVSKFSDITSEYDYGDVPTLAQKSCFVWYTITFKPASSVAAPVDVEIWVNPDNSTWRSGSITTLTDGDGGDKLATFVAAFSGGTTVLDYDNLKVSWNDGVGDCFKEFSFKSSFAADAGKNPLRAGKYYTFNRTVTNNECGDEFTIEIIEDETWVKLNKPTGNYQGTWWAQYGQYAESNNYYVECEVHYKDGSPNETFGPYRFTENDPDKAQLIQVGSPTYPDKTFSAGDKIIIRGTYPSYWNGKYHGAIIQAGPKTNNVDKPFYAYGNLLRLTGGNDVPNEGFNRAFLNQKGLKSKDGRDGGEVRKLLIKPINDPNGTVNKSSFKELFSGCSNLTIGPEIYFTQSSSEQGQDATHYSQMFKDCNNLIVVPLIQLEDPGPGSNAYGGMFQFSNYTISSLKYIKCLTSNSSFGNFTADWFSKNNIPSSGWFVIDDGDDAWTLWNAKPKYTYPSSNPNGLPQGWDIYTKSGVYKKTIE